MPLYHSLIFIFELKIMVSQLTHNFGGSVRSFESMSALSWLQSYFRALFHAYTYYWLIFVMTKWKSSPYWLEMPHKMSVIDNALPRIFPLISSLLTFGFLRRTSLSGFTRSTCCSWFPWITLFVNSQFWRSHCISCKYILHLYLDVIHMTKDLAHKLR